MKLELENGMVIDLTSVEVIAIVPERDYIPVNYYGLNIKINYDKKDNNIDFDGYICSKVGGGKSETVHAYVFNEKIRIPVDIHGGVVDQCYYGYITKEVFAG